MNANKTKLVCTLGPASNSAEMIEAFIDAGMTVARLNFSHGTHAEHAEQINIIRTIARQKNTFVAILQDLQGPKIRTGKLKNGKIELKKGEIYTLQYGSEQIDNEIPIDYEHLAKDIAVGSRILLDDGLLSMRVSKICNNNVECEALHGGILKPRKGVNFPDSHLSIPSTTEKDIKDLFFGISQSVDYVALSFVQTAKDVQKLQATIKNFGADIPVVAKIEMKLAIENLHDICEVADAIMVARGDLGVECGFAQVASLQKRIIKAAQESGKPVIVATQMLDSMQEVNTPTKAEILDVANAVYDGADATMLSGESASGKFPLLAVQTMYDIVGGVDKHLDKNPTIIQSFRSNDASIQNITSHAAVELAAQSKAAAIVCLTMSGSTARSISSYHPTMPIYAISPKNDTMRQMCLVRGVYPVFNSELFTTEKAVAGIGKILAKNNLVKIGDKIVIMAGIPLEDMRPTNFVKLYFVTAEDFIN